MLVNLDSFWLIILVGITLFFIKTIYNLINKRKTTFNEVFIYLFIIYIISLVYIVIIKKTSWSGVNIIPFQEIFRYSFGSLLFFKNVIGNIFMFIPYGFFIGYFTKLNGFKVSLIVFLTSINIESLQLLIGRVFDIDDIILNLVGGLIGFYVYHISLKCKTYIKSD